MGKRRVVTVIGIVALVIGVGVLCFPYVSQWLYTRQAEGLIVQFEEEAKDYIDSVETASGDRADYDGLYMAMEEYNAEIYENRQSNLTDPFSYQEASFNLRDWGFSENVVGYIDIPRMKVRIPVYLGATTENMRKGAGHLSQTSLPIGGANSNSVLAAHRGMSTAAMFRDIELLEIGDSVTLANLWETLNYRVVETRVIYPNDINAILIQEERDLLTLITCHPYRHNYQRYVVYCERVQ